MLSFLNEGFKEIEKNIFVTSVRSWWGSCQTLNPLHKELKEGTKGTKSFVKLCVFLGDLCAMDFYFSTRSATFSTCIVWGNMSTG